eukprot:gene52681-64376_t
MSPLPRRFGCVPVLAKQTGTPLAGLPTADTTRRGIQAGVVVRRGASGGRERFQMRGVVHLHEARGLTGEVEDGEVARVLRKAPIGRQRQVEQMAEQDAVHAVMPHEDDLFARMSRQRETQGVRNPYQNVLKRFAIGKPRKLGRGPPEGIGLGVGL